MVPPLPAASRPLEDNEHPRAGIADMALELGELDLELLQLVLVGRALQLLVVRVSAAGEGGLLDEFRQSRIVEVHRDGRSADVEDDRLGDVPGLAPRMRPRMRRGLRCLLAGPFLVCHMRSPFPAT